MGRVAWTALKVYGASFLLVFLVITGYAAFLAFQARGAPDQTMIQTLPNQYAPWLGSISLILFTFLGAMWLARFVKTDIERHGLALGVIVSLVNLIFDGVAFSLVALVTAVLVVAAGWLEGRLATRACAVKRITKIGQHLNAVQFLLWYPHHNLKKPCRELRALQSFSSS